MSSEFDTRKAVETLKEIIHKYETNETLEWYEEHTYIKDMLYFIGLSIDREKYRNANGFERFLAKIEPIANGTGKSVFKRELGLRK